MHFKKIFKIGITGGVLICLPYFCYFRLNYVQNINLSSIWYICISCIYLWTTMFAETNLNLNSKVCKNLKLNFKQVYFTGSICLGILSFFHYFYLNYLDYEVATSIFNERVKDITQIVDFARTEHLVIDENNLERQLAELKEFGPGVPISELLFYLLATQPIVLLHAFLIWRFSKTKKTFKSIN